MDPLKFEGYFRKLVDSILEGHPGQLISTDGKLSAEPEVMEEPVQMVNNVERLLGYGRNK